MPITDSNPKGLTGKRFRESLFFLRELRMQRLELEHEQIILLAEKTKDLNTKNG